jgi:hypothetical protein
MALRAWWKLLPVVCWLASCSKGTTVDINPPDPLTPDPAAVVPAESATVRRVQPEAPQPQPPPLSALASIRYSPETASSVNEVLSVTVRVELKGSQGAHEVIANFEAPGSMPFERRVKVIDGSAFDTHVVEFVLPVAGTMIPQTGLSGIWTVALYHDGEKLTAPTFELTR